MREIKAPSRPGLERRIFLAGSIEMGQAEQVSWELDMLDAADVVVMYLAPGTKSPVSLLELGLWARSGKLKVCCPEGFWRRGNVEVVCQRHQIPLFDTLDDLLDDLMAELA
jgi:hypothetical protein